MSLPALSLEDAYPVIHQTMLDAYRIDSMLNRYPYSDFTEMDLGIRRLVWGTYSTTSPIFQLDNTADRTPCQLLVIRSNLDFYNLIAMVPNAENEDYPDLLCFMPVRTAPASTSIVRRIMRENGIPESQLDQMLYIYASIPVVDLNNLIPAVQHLVGAFVPAFASCDVHHVDYASEQHEMNYTEDRMERFTADAYERIAEQLQRCARYVTAGNSAAAVDEIRRLGDLVAPIAASGLSNSRVELSSLNVFLATRLLETPVHPTYIFRQLQTFKNRIDHASGEELRHLPYEIVRKYSMLARNYSYENYSMLVRNVINYIDQHLAEELSLSLLAEEFGRNASYLSDTFHKEVGETVSTYIARQRIQMSLQYFNTTNMPVAEVAQAVGYEDFSYFSRLFRRYVGQSPREYRRMIDK